MELQDFLTFMPFIKNGTYTKIKYEVEPSGLRKAFKGRVVKITSRVVRLGVRYQKIKTIADVKTVFNDINGKWYNKYLILNEKTNELRLRCTKAQNKSKVHTTYFLDGEEVDYKYLVEVGALPEPKNDYSYAEVPIFDVKLKNIISLG